jgi:hypothetical protein
VPLQPIVAAVTDHSGPWNPATVAAIDLLGALAYGEITAFERMAADATMAPTIDDKVALQELAALELAHFQRLRAHLAELGVDHADAMAPFKGPLDAFHEATQPRDWLEGLVKAYVGDGIARDFYREVATFLDDEKTRDLVVEVLSDVGHTAFVVERVTSAIAEDPKVAGRLALWARRLVGEALTQTQRVAVERDALIDLVSEKGDLADLVGLFKRVTDAHTQRMQTLGLTPN